MARPGAIQLLQDVKRPRNSLMFVIKRFFLKKVLLNYNANEIRLSRYVGNVRITSTHTKNNFCYSICTKTIIIRVHNHKGVYSTDFALRYNDINICAMWANNVCEIYFSVDYNGKLISKLPSTLDFNVEHKHMVMINHMTEISDMLIQACIKHLA